MEKLNNFMKLKSLRVCLSELKVFHLGHLDLSHLQEGAEILMATVNSYPWSDSMRGFENILESFLGKRGFFRQSSGWWYQSASKLCKM